MNRQQREAKRKRAKQHQKYCKNHWLMFDMYQWEIDEARPKDFEEFRKKIESSIASAF